MRSLLLSIFLFFSIIGSLLSQGNNPFELKNRKQQTPKEQEVTPTEIVAPPVNSPEPIETPNPPADTDKASDNPFNLNRPEPGSSTPEPSIAIVDPSDSKPKGNPFDIGGKTKANSTKAPVNPELATNKPTTSGSSQVIIRKKVGKQEGQQQTFLFWTILGLLFTGTLVFILFQPFIAKSYRAFTNDNMLKLLQRENNGRITFPYIILYAFFFINAGIFIYLASTHFGFVRSGYGSFLLKCIFGIAAFFIIKHLLLSFLSAIFQINKEIEQYTFTIVVFSIILGIVLVPFNVLTAFSTTTISQIAFYGAFIVIGLFYLFRFFRSLFIASKFIALSKFHFFMYLCTIEIAPIAILIKVLMNSSGVQ